MVSLAVLLTTCVEFGPFEITDGESVLVPNQLRSSEAGTGVSADPVNLLCSQAVES